MTRSIVLCLFLAVVSGIVGATWAYLAGWGWVAALALYSAAGSASLIAAAVAQAAAPEVAQVARSAPRRAGVDRAFA